MRVRRALVLASLAAFVAAASSAQSIASGANAPRQLQPPKQSPDFGTQNPTAVRLSAFNFSTLSGAAYGWGSAGASRYSTSGPLNASFQVPTGSLITRVEFDYCDPNATNHMSMSLFECDNEGQGCTSIMTPLVSLGDGCTYVSNPGLSLQVDNYNHIYILEVQFGASDGSNLVTGAIISYQLQVSPGPAVATFPDVPTSSGQFQFVEALVSAGITAGCGGGNYCPNNPVTRGQMAVFLAKALGLHYPY